MSSTIDQSLTYVPSIGAKGEPGPSAGSGAGPDAQLMDAFLAGDDRAFAALFDRHNERLFLYCARLLGNPEQAEDIVQGLWERVIRLRGEGPGVRNPAGFLLTIARNLCLNHLKRERRRVPFDGTAEAACERKGIHARTDLEEAVIDALDRLPMKYREVLVLNVYSGYDFEEIAGMLGLHVAAVWKRASRGRAQLRKAFEKSDLNPPRDTNRSASQEGNAP